MSSFIPYVSLAAGSLLALVNFKEVLGKALLGTSEEHVDVDHIVGTYRSALQRRTHLETRMKEVDALSQGGAGADSASASSASHSSSSSSSSSTNSATAGQRGTAAGSSEPVSTNASEEVLDDDLDGLLGAPITTSSAFRSRAAATQKVDADANVEAGASSAAGIKRERDDDVKAAMASFEAGGTITVKIKKPKIRVVEGGGEI
jgi:hypothetical protein